METTFSVGVETLTTTEAKQRVKDLTASGVNVQSNSGIQLPRNKEYNVLLTGKIKQISYVRDGQNCCLFLAEALHKKTNCDFSVSENDFNLIKAKAKMRVFVNEKGYGRMVK